jgi:hypothetical protein
MRDHQAAHHRIDAQGEDHRGHAQIGHPDAVDEADQEADAKPDGNRERPADRTTRRLLTSFETYRVAITRLSMSLP